MSEKSLTRRNAYEIITSRIFAALEKGTVPWHQPWTSQPPANLVTKKPYRGVNVFVLRCTTFGSPWWSTYRQVQLLGGQVHKGERGCPVCFWKWIDKSNEGASENESETDHSEQRIPLLRYYIVIPGTPYRIIDSASLHQVHSAEVASVAGGKSVLVWFARVGVGRDKTGDCRWCPGLDNLVWCPR